MKNEPVKIISRVAPRIPGQSRGWAPGTRGRPSWPGGCFPRQTRARPMTRTRGPGAGEAGGRNTGRTPGALRPALRSHGSSSRSRRRQRGETRPPPSPGSSLWTSWRPARWGIDQWEASISVTWLTLTNQRPLFCVVSQFWISVSVCLFGNFQITDCKQYEEHLILNIEQFVSNLELLWREQIGAPSAKEGFPIRPRSSVISGSDSISGEYQYFQIQPISVLSPSILIGRLVFLQKLFWFWSRIGDYYQSSDIWSTSKVTDEMMTLWSWFITILNPNSPNCFAISHFGFMLHSKPPRRINQKCSIKRTFCFPNLPPFKS